MPRQAAKDARILRCWGILDFSTRPIGKATYFCAAATSDRGHPRRNGWFCLLIRIFSRNTINLTMNLTLKIWRQPNPKAQGRIVTYEARNIPEEASFL